MVAPRLVVERWNHIINSLCVTAKMGASWGWVSGAEDARPYLHEMLALLSCADAQLSGST